MQLFFDFMRIYIWRLKMMQMEEQNKSEILLFTPPFFREFRINPFIY